MRHRWIAVVAVALAATACTSPGKRYDVLDVRVLAGPTANPTQPTVAQAATTSVSFTLFDTSVQHPLAHVGWRAYADPTIPTDPTVPVDPTTGAVITDGFVDLPADGTAVVTFTPSTLAAAVTPGIHRYYVVADPDHLISERDEGDNTGSVTVAIADCDVAYAATPSFASTARDINGNVAMQFALTDTPNPSLADPTTAPTASVTCHVYRDSYASPTDHGPEVMPYSGSTAQPVAIAPTATATVTLVLPLDPGPYTLFVVFDPGVVESNAANDVVAVGVTVTTGG